MIGAMHMGKLKGQWKERRTIRIGLFFTFALAAVVLILNLRYVNKPGSPAFAQYNLGIDLLGAFTCAFLFTGSRKQMDHASTSFSLLLVELSVSFTVNALLWISTGTADLRREYFWCCLVSKWVDVAMIYFFYQYVRDSLGFEGKLTKLMNLVLPWMAAASLIIDAVNIFYPLTFAVDAQGVYGEGVCPILEDIFLIVAAIAGTILILSCGAAFRSKAAAMSFILIPVFEYALTGGAFGYATQYGATLISLVLMYCVIFNERTGRLATTQTELAMATQIQESSLPSVFPPFPERREFDIYASMDPAKEVGGDFYDFFLLDEDRLGIVIADVSGKGIPAALFMMISKTILQNCANLGVGPAEILARTNRALCADNDADMFVTAWVGILELSTGRMVCANAGHEYPSLCRNGKFELVKDQHGFVLGYMEDSDYTEYELKLDPGDRLFLYTDGVPEAATRGRELFGTDRMLEALNKSREAGLKDVLKSVRDAVDAFVGGAEQFDDMTMLCLEYRGKGN